ncbi:MAG: S8 family serine peptidase [Candidatus Thorarchaeota archaeon]|nr:MAG: S8 family serine peptidase [Candidatus Thorarchaeota archaeon]
MKTRVLLLTLLLGNLLIIPTLGVVHSSGVSAVYYESGPMVESRLRLELASRKVSLTLSSEPSTRAVLEFEDELTVLEIQEIEREGIQFERRWEGVVHSGRIYSAKVNSLESLQKVGRLGLLRATSGSKKFYPAISSSVPAIGATDVWTNLRKDGDQIDGSGVTIAVIDTGVAWLHPSFWRASTGPITVIEDGGDYFADLNNNSIPDSNEGPIYTTGDEVTSASIYTDYLFIDVGGDQSFDFDHGDRWLGGIDSDSNNEITIPSEEVVVLGESKISYLYDQEYNSVYVRGVNLTSAPSASDYNGHGSHIASTAAGGQYGHTAMVGAAPGADLIIIKSPLESSDVLDGIYFAVEHGADVINMSFSSYLGFLDGTDLEDLAVTEALRASGTLTTLAAGNLGGRNKHARFQVPGGQSSGATLTVHAPPDYSFLNILWHSSDDDEHVILNSPSGYPIDLGEIATVTGSAWELEFDELNAYAFADTSSRGTNRIIVQVSTDAHNWTGGSWTVTVTNPSGDSVWVDAYAWDNTWTGSSLQFTSMTDLQRTISSPGTADLGIVASSYDESGDTISSTSSRGPRIDGAPLSIVAAPGVGISAASRSLSSLWSTRSGSSMAAPHLAGVLALIRQASDSDNGWRDLSALIQGAGGNDDHFSPVDPSWGYGLCDAVWSVHHVLDFSFAGEIGAWTGVPSAFQGASNLSIDGSVDITEVRIYPEVGSLNIAVELRADSNFSTDDVLSVHWDVDNNPASGDDGIDILVNISSNQASIFEWVVDHYQSSSLSVNWLNRSSHAFLRFQRTDSSQLGSLTLATHNSSHSNLDMTTALPIPTLWRPTISELTLDAQEDEFNVLLVLDDKDTPSGDLNIDWTVADGALSTLESESQDGSTVNVSVELSNYNIDEVLSVIFSISDGSNWLYLPPVALSTGSGLEFGILSAHLDQTSIRVGPFIQEHLTGEIVIAGADFVDEVELALLAFYGSWLNFTLIGSGGTFTIDILLAGVSPGDYEPYAVATSLLGTMDERQLPTLSVVEDYSMVFIIGGIMLGVILIIGIAYIRTKRSAT